MAAEALVLGLQVTGASLEGLAAGTRDGLYIAIIGGARATVALHRPRRKVQLELDALNKYSNSCACEDIAASDKMNTCREALGALA